MIVLWSVRVMTTLASCVSKRSTCDFTANPGVFMKDGQGKWLRLTAAAVSIVALVSVSPRSLSAGDGEALQCRMCHQFYKTIGTLSDGTPVRMLAHRLEGDESGCGGDNFAA